MEKFPANISFKYPWRKYQARVIKELKRHLDDNKLHIIAPPGSGKTVLGLEVMLRLNKPTLILSPTLTIKNQWVERFVSLFLDTSDSNNDWVSNNIHHPKFVTSSTYQALHAAMKQGEGSDFLDKLKSLNIGTIIVDEAHHLKNEWWKTLTKTVKELNNPTIVALTATPPFDVTYAEWKRYEDFCGPVDAEISVPELVMEKNLCYHQDFVHISSPSENENMKIQKFRTRIFNLFQQISNDQEFADMIRSSKLLVNVEKKHSDGELFFDYEIEEILENVEFYSSIIIYLNNFDQNPPAALLKIMALQNQAIPEFNIQWLEILLTGILNKKLNLPETFSGKVESLEKLIKSLGVRERNKIYLYSSENIRKILANSQSKYSSIIEIVERESTNLKQDLRLVILTDYIRLSDMPKSDSSAYPSKIGVIPIFELLRKQNFKYCELCVLTGSIVIVSSALFRNLDKIYSQATGAKIQLEGKPLSYTSDFISLNLTNENRQSIVSIITNLFEKGDINTIVGTKSLLAEGWDAPSINTLIMASFVGSHVTSNQMRGRAIRAKLENPEKTANIWHLVCSDEFSGAIGEDYEILSRRFKAFMGVSFKQDRIENGIERLNIKQLNISKEYIDLKNNEMLDFASSRQLIIKKWKNALEPGGDGIKKRYEIYAPQKVEQMNVPRNRVPRDIVLRNTIKALSYQGFSLGTSTLLYLFRTYIVNAQRYSISPIDFLIFGLLLTSIITLPYLYKSLKLFLKNGPIASNLVAISRVVLKTLYINQKIKTEINDVSIYTWEDEDKSARLTILGLSNYENTIVFDCIKEILDPVEDPRYILVRTSSFFKKLRKDYHSVPKILSQKKWEAEAFEENWNKIIGPGKVYYTRNILGREIMLRARGESLASAFIPSVEKMSIWE